MGNHFLNEATLQYYLHLINRNRGLKLRLPSLYFEQIYHSNSNNVTRKLQPLIILFSIVFCKENTWQHWHGDNNINIQLLYGAFFLALMLQILNLFSIYKCLGILPW